MTYICISWLTIIGLENGLSPGQCQAIIWTSAGIFLFGTLATNFNEILIEIYKFSFTKNAFPKYRLENGFNVLTYLPIPS